MSTPEGEVVNACLEYLRLRRVFAWRNNSGATRIKKLGQREHLVRFGLPGSADILGIYRGRFLAIECKAPGGKLSEKQKDFLATIKREGGIAFVAKSVEDVESALDRAEKEAS